MTLRITICSVGHKHNIYKSNVKMQENHPEVNITKSTSGDNGQLKSFSCHEFLTPLFIAENQNSALERFESEYIKTKGAQ